MNLASIVTESASRVPDGCAVKLGDRQVSYRDLDEASARLAGLLTQRGVGHGDRVAVMLPNVPQFLIAYYGALRLGAIVVPVNVLLKAREAAFYLSDSGASLLLAWHEFAEAAESAAATAEAECLLVVPGEFERLLEAHACQPGMATGGADTAVILYTSGTTGRPKGAELTHDSLRRNAAASVALFGLGKQSVTLGALPLFHTFGQTCAMNATLSAGGCLTLLQRFDADRALQVIERDRVSVFEGVPTMYSALLHARNRGQFDSSSLRLCASGGAPMPAELMRAFEKAFDCTILEGYGLSETSPIASFNHSQRERKPGSIGTPIEGVQMKVVDDDGRGLPSGELGEIVIRGHNLMKGYWHNQAATAEAIRGGWFYSGDLARVDEDGYFFVVDRVKDMIIRGGYNVYPREIEEVLYEHPAVREAAVIGIPHAELGQEVAAAIALKDGHDVDADTMKAHVQGHVAAYKYPRHVWLLDELPKGPTGKILKREIQMTEGQGS